MKSVPDIIVLCGGSSAEAEVSLVSGNSVYTEMVKLYPSVRKIELTGNHLPTDLDPAREVIFPAMHGDFGEDGQLQGLLEAAGFAYAGSDSTASALCMNKPATKALLEGSGFKLARELTFTASNPPPPDDLLARLGERLVVKPVDKGSSVGVHLVEGRDQLAEVLDHLDDGWWMAETRIDGREMSIGILQGEAMGIVEIIPRDGVYDYAHKYTAGATRYEFPAALEAAQQKRIEAATEAVFQRCGCRDFARLDFIFSPRGEAYFLEVNTIPGLTPTSLLPKSASCRGLDFGQLIQRMMQGALRRFSDNPISQNA